MSVQGQIREYWTVFHDPFVAGTQATITKAAIANAIHVVTGVYAYALNTAVAGFGRVQLTLGAAPVWGSVIIKPLFSAANPGVAIVNENFKIIGTENTAFTFAFTAAGAADWQSVSMTGYTIY